MTTGELANETAARRGLGDAAWADAVWRRAQQVAFAVIAYMAGLSALYFIFIAFPDVLETHDVTPVFPAAKANWALLVAHCVFALPPLLLGLVGFIEGVRRKRPKLHRDAGLLYCVCIWLSAPAGALLATANRSGPLAGAGFFVLGVFWFATTWRAYSTARAKNFVDHRRWMIRSYALTLAFVTVRPLFVFGPMGGFSSADWQIVVAWACWVPNLALAELYLWATRPNGALRSFPQRAAA
ncbi:MAG: DUF2306 domain-containing protein [Parvularculaceae bacterium]